MTNDLSRVMALSVGTDITTEAELQRGVDLFTWPIIVRLGGCLRQALHLRVGYQGGLDVDPMGWRLPSCRTSKAKRRTISAQTR